MQQGKMMRVTGEVEFLDDPELKKTIYEKIRVFEDIAGQPIWPILEVFRIKSGEAHFWTMLDILKEPELERIKF